MRSGSSGDGERCSTATNAAMSAADPASSPSVVAEPQPSLVARVSA